MEVITDRDYIGVVRISTGGGEVACSLKAATTIEEEVACGDGGSGHREPCLASPRWVGRR
jgi:hypothetical protein